MMDKRISFENSQEIKEILQESSESDMLAYPVLKDSELREILQNIGENIELEMNEIDKYFLELTNKIEEIIGRLKETRKLKLKEYGEIYHNFQVCWSEILDIQNLRELLVNENEEQRLT